MCKVQGRVTHQAKEAAKEVAKEVAMEYDQVRQEKEDAHDIAWVSQEQMQRGGLLPQAHQKGGSQRRVATQHEV